MYEEPELKSTEAAQILAAGAAIADGKLFDIADTPAVLVPEGYRVETYPDHREAPQRIKQTIHASTATAFVAYLARYGDSEATVVFAESESDRFTGIIDYHLPNSVPDWCQHRIIYACPRSREWELWRCKSGAHMNQVQFAEFIEDNLVDIVQPAGAEMLEIVKSLEAKSNVRFKSAIRLDNGETQLVYEEVIDGAAGAKGQLKIPQMIKLALRVFQGEDPYAVEARFKYRIREGSVVLWYELIRPHRIVEDSFAGILARIRDQLGAIPVLEAVPE